MKKLKEMGSIFWGLFKIRKTWIVLIVVLSVIAVCHILEQDYGKNTLLEAHKLALVVVGAAAALLTFIINTINSWEQKQNALLLQFEDKFFRLIEFQRKIREEIDYEDKQTNLHVTGRKVFHYLFEERKMLDGIKGFKSKLTDQYNDIEHSYIDNKDHRLLEHYFRHLYRIIRYVDDMKILDDKQKHEYVSMLRAQLSEYELVYIFLYAVSKHNAYEADCNKNCGEKDCLKCDEYNNGKGNCKRFKPYIEKYVLLDALQDTKHILPELCKFFADSAYHQKYLNSSFIASIMNKICPKCGKK